MNIKHLIQAYKILKCMHDIFTLHTQEGIKALAKNRTAKNSKM